MESGLYDYWLQQGIPNGTVCDSLPTTVTVHQPFSLASLWVGERYHFCSSALVPFISLIAAYLNTVLYRDRVIENILYKNADNACLFNQNHISVVKGCYTQINHCSTTMKGIHLMRDETSFGGCLVTRLPGSRPGKLDGGYEVSYYAVYLRTAVLAKFKQSYSPNLFLDSVL